MKPRQLQQEFWEIPCPKSWDSDGGPAVFEEELGGDPVPQSLNQKHSSSTGNFSLEFSSSRGSLGREENISQLSNASKVHFQQTLHLCVFILGIFFQDWPHAVLSDNPHSTNIIPHPPGLSQSSTNAPSMDPNVLFSSQQQQGHDFGSLLVKFVQGTRQGGREEAQENRLAFPLPRILPWFFSENTKIALTNSSFCQPNIWYLKKKTVPVKCDISEAFWYEVLSLTNLPQHTLEM